MPFIKPSFSIPENIPIIGGPWGPFINTNLTRKQQYTIFIIFFITLLLIFIFGMWSYYSYRTKNHNDNINPPTPKPISTESNVYDFLGISNIIDIKSLLVGMGAGIVFGLIDNGGLWFGMDAFDPVFDADKIPWVYGYGGRRPYSGYVDKDNCKYHNVKFKDGILKRTELIHGIHPSKICQRIENHYRNIENKLNHPGYNENLKEKISNTVDVNEMAFADPNSELFLGHNMTKNDFFKYLLEHRINENTYNERIDNYRDYLNDKNIPESGPKAWSMGILSQKQKAYKTSLKRQIAKLEGFRLLGLGKPQSVNIKQQINKLKETYNSMQEWPGKNKKLVESWMSGWKPGKLTNAGIGNLYSDILGSFLSSFVGVLIINMTGLSNTSILSETFGIIVGCILGILLPRTLFNKLSYQT